MKKIKNSLLLLVQRLWISLELFNRNGLTNHAAACAYGFLLSAAPALLFIAFFILRTLAASPELAEDMLRQIAPLFAVFDIQDSADNFFSVSRPGLAGLIPLFMIFWTVRICALSIRLGLGIIFPGPKSIFRDNAVTLGFGILTMLFIVFILFALRQAINFLYSPGFSFLNIYSPFLIRLFFMFTLGLLILAAYRFIPANHPKVKNIIPGVLICLIFFMIFSAGFSLIISPDRYNLLYGALGRLFLFLVNVYFFFVFFFFGAQLIQVLGLSDALLFARFRRSHSKLSTPHLLLDRLFSAPPGPLKKYTGVYRKGDFIFTQHSQGQEVYYILSGKVGVYLDTECLNRIAFIEEGNFFGEMASATAEERVASIKAETDVSVIILPPELFHTVLQIDPDTNKNLIKTLSERLKSADQQIMSGFQNK